MKSFSTFLAEGRDAPLYHGTSLDSTYSMLQSNNIRGSKGHIHSRYANRAGVYMSRSKWAAMHHIITIRYDKNPVIISLDQAKLVQNYHIEPNANDQMWDRAEEWLEGSITDLDKYITKIEIYYTDTFNRVMKEKSSYPRLKKHPKLFFRGKFINQ